MYCKSSKPSLIIKLSNGFVESFFSTFIIMLFPFMLGIIFVPKNKMIVEKAKIFLNRLIFSIFSTPNFVKFKHHQLRGIL